MVKIEIDIPERLNEFLRAMAEFADVNVKAYVEKTLITGIQGDIDDLDGVPIWNVNHIKTKFGVEEWLKKEKTEK